MRRTFLISDIHVVVYQFKTANTRIERAHACAVSLLSTSQSRDDDAGTIDDEGSATSHK